MRSGQLAAGYVASSLYWHVRQAQPPDESAIHKDALLSGVYELTRGRGDAHIGPRG